MSYSLSSSKSSASFNNNDVYCPKHYKVFADIDAIQIIARSMTVDMFKGYCFGNVLKYRLRVNKKDPRCIEKDLHKADFYMKLFDIYKSCCYDYKQK